MILFSVDESGKSIVSLEGKSGKTISIGCHFPPKFPNSGTPSKSPSIDWRATLMKNKTKAAAAVPEWLFHFLWEKSDYSNYPTMGYLSIYRFSVYFVAIIFINSHPPDIAKSINYRVRLWSSKSFAMMDFRHSLPWRSSTSPTNMPHFIQPWLGARDFANRRTAAMTAEYTTHIRIGRHFLLNFTPHSWAWAGAWGRFPL